MKKLGLLSILSTLLAFGVTAPACTSAKNTYNCDKICDRYKSCFDANYDADACQSKCEANADDSAFAEKASDCESCIDDKSCTGSFACADECVGIVP